MKKTGIFLAALFFMAFLFSARFFSGAPQEALFHPQSAFGVASWYKEAAGMTCASRHFPKGAFVKITNLMNGRSVVCQVAEAGPHRRLFRVVDLSREAFGRIAELSDGLVPVRVSKI